MVFSGRNDEANVDAVEERARRIGAELLRLARENRTGPFSSRFWSDQLMSWAMRDPAFKVQLFRFVDVFPMLGTPRQVYDCLVDYLGRPEVTLPPGMEFGLKAGGLAKGVMPRRSPAASRGWPAISSRASTRLRPFPRCASGGAAGWRSASICWAKPA